MSNENEWAEQAAAEMEQRKAAFIKQNEELMNRLNKATDHLSNLNDIAVKAEADIRKARDIHRSIERTANRDNN
jgi:hypothetical protein